MSHVIVFDKTYSLGLSPPNILSAPPLEVFQSLPRYNSDNFSTVSPKYTTVPILLDNESDFFNVNEPLTPIDSNDKKVKLVGDFPERVGTNNDPTLTVHCQSPLSYGKPSQYKQIPASGLNPG